RERHGLTERQRGEQERGQGHDVGPREPATRERALDGPERRQKEDRGVEEGRPPRLDRAVGRGGERQYGDERRENGSGEEAREGAAARGGGCPYSVGAPTARRRGGVCD